MLNLRDVAFKALWTGVAAVAAYVIQATVGLAEWWAPPFTLVLTVVLALARQKTGQVPPTAEQIDRSV